MTAEEKREQDAAICDIVKRFQHGERELIGELWGKASPYVSYCARQHYSKFKPLGGFEIDDLINEGFFVIVDAAEHCACEGHFLSYVGVALRTTWLSLIYKRPGSLYGPQNMIDAAMSLDAPMGKGDDGWGLKDIITAGDSATASGSIASMEHQVWLEELRKALDEALHFIPEDQAKALRHRYASPDAPRDKAEIKLADRGLANLRRKPQVYALLHPFIVCCA